MLPRIICEKSFLDYILSSTRPIPFEQDVEIVTWVAIIVGNIPVYLYLISAMTAYKVFNV